MNGVYVVIAELPEAMAIQVGRWGSIRFEKGSYGYVGSAMNGLEKRLARHLNNRKKLHWHIDYLLNVATCREIVYAETNQRLECSIARTLSGKLAGIPKFGCSDCNCESHLFFCQDLIKILKSVLYSFNLLNLNPLKITDSPDFTLRQR